MSGIADWVGFASLIAALFAVGLRRSCHPQEYLVADRDIGLGRLVATLVMTEFNTTTLMAFSAFGYRVGPMAVGLPLVFLIGLGFYTATVARPWKRFNRLSVAEFFTERYGSGLGRFASALLVVAMLGFSATYVKSMTLIFLPFVSGFGPWWLSLVLTAAVVALTITGGLVSVVRTDVLGFVVSVAILPALLIIAAWKYGGLASLGAVFPAGELSFAPVTQWNHPDLPYWFVLSLTVLTCFTYISSPWYGQKIFAARDERTAFLGVGIAAILVFLLYASVQTAAAYYRLENPSLADAQTVVPRMIEAWFPPLFRGVAFVALFLAAMTTLAGVWSALAAMVVADFFPVRLSRLGRQRALTLAIAAVSWAGANVLGEDILNRLILANIPIAALSFALLAGFHWKRASRAGAWSSVAVGVSWGIGCYAFVGESGGYTWYWAMYGIPLIFASGFAVSLLRPDPVRSECEPPHRPLPAYR